MATDTPEARERLDLDGIEFRLANRYADGTNLPGAMEDVRALLDEHKRLRNLVACIEPATLDYFDGSTEPEDPTPLPAGYRKVEDAMVEEHLGKEGAVRTINYGTPGVPTFGRIDWQYHPRTGKRRLVLVSEGHHYAKARELYGDHVEREDWVDRDTVVEFYVLD